VAIDSGPYSARGGIIFKINGRGNSGYRLFELGLYESEAGMEMQSEIRATRIKFLV
jgi:hypothetical protein